MEIRGTKVTMGMKLKMRMMRKLRIRRSGNDGKNKVEDNDED